MMSMEINEINNNLNIIVKCSKDVGYIIYFYCKGYHILTIKIDDTTRTYIGKFASSS